MHKDRFLQSGGWRTQAAGLGFVRPDSTLNKASSLQCSSSLFLFLSAWRALSYGISNAEKSRAEDDARWIYLHVSTPQNTFSAHSLLRAAVLCLNWKYSKSYSILSFYRRWFIIAVQLFFQLELKFIMWGFFWPTALCKGTSIYWIVKHWRTLMYLVLCIFILLI